MSEPIFSDLEHLYLIAALSSPIPCRHIGKSKEKHIFEPVRLDFRQRKNGSRLIFLLEENFRIGNDKIKDKRLVILN